MTKWKKLILPLLVFITLGFLRMHWSYQLNNILSIRMYDMTMFPVSPYLSFIKEWSISEVYTAKWVLTFFFLVSFCAISIWMTRAVDYRHWKVVPALYIGMLAIAFVTYLVGWAVWNGPTGHNAARGIIEIGYTPLPALLIILWASRSGSRT